MPRAVLLVLALSFAGLLSGAATARQDGGSPVALVTAETENELVAVSFPDGRVLRRVTLPAGPENVAASERVVAVVSPAAGAVSLLGARSLRVTKVLRGFASPHMAALAPIVCRNGAPPCRSRWAYVTDDPLGQLDVISLQQKRVTARLAVGLGAHHMALSPDGRRMWIALGEHARQIALVDLSRPRRPRLVGRFDPGFVVHDLAFSPDGRRVWVTSSASSRVVVFGAASRRRLFSVAAGPAPQHVAFSLGTRHVRAYLTSGYGSRIESVDARTGRVIRVARVPYGSFNLAPLGSYVVTSSLMRGTVTELDPNLRTVRSVTVAPAARAVAAVVW